MSKKEERGGGTRICPLVKKSLAIAGLLFLLLFSLTTKTLLASRSGPGSVLLPQGRSEIAAQGTDQGRLAGSTPVKLAVILKLRNRQNLDSLIAAQNTPGSPSYHKFLTPAQFLSAYGPTQQDDDAVAAFLAGYGFSVKKTANRQLLIAQGTAAEAGQAFQTELHAYNVDGKQEYANKSSPQVPASLSGVIKTVQGLDSKKLNSNLKSGQAGSAASAMTAVPGYSPDQISTAYDYPNLHGYSGGGRTIAVATAGDFSNSDISAFENQFGYQPASLSRVFCDVQSQGCGGPNQSPGVDDPETTLDVEWSTSLAPGAGELVYIAPAQNGAVSTADLTDEYNQIVSDNSADVVTSSWGGCEDSNTAGQDDGIFAQGAAQGQTWLIASGDDGSNCDPNGSFGVDYPASSPYVTAMGGTTLNLDGSNNISSETAWGGSGGGTSGIELRPSWEYGSSFFANGMRWTPDLAMDGDPNTGMSIYYTGPNARFSGWGQAAGTSIDAPFASALAAEIGQYGNKRLGIFAAPVNRLANSSYHSTFFHDITAGSNGFYAAGPGWDPATGWGSPDGYLLMLNYKNMVVRNYFWTWYDSISMRDWVLMANPAGSGQNFSFGLSIGNRSEALASNFGLGPGTVPPGGSLTAIYPGLMGGPVKAGSITGNKAIVSQRSLLGNSFEEVLGTDAGKLSNHFYWTWYDEQSPGMTNWVLISNPGQDHSGNSQGTVTATIKIAGLPVWSGAIAPGANATPTFPGRMGGPVEVVSSGDVMASQRVLSNYGSAFNEVPGIPAAELTDHYYWTWYDMQSPGARNWVLIANPNPNPVTAHIRIAGAVRWSGALAPGQIVTPTFPGIMGGPVEVWADSGSEIIATQRSIFGPSFEEVPGLAASQTGGFSALSNDYNWTWYDQQSPGMSNWVLVANPNASPVTATIRIGGFTATYGIPPGGNITPTFSGRMGGPVEVTATGNVIASQRVLYNGFFNEVLGEVLR